MARDINAIKKHKKLALIGGGSISLFTAIAAKALGFTVYIFDDRHDAIAANYGDKFICIEWKYLTNFLLSNEFDFIIFESKTLPAYLLNELASPFPENVFAIILKDRIIQKRFLYKLGMNILDFHIVANINDLQEGIQFPVVIKAAERGKHSVKFIANNYHDLKKVIIEHNTSAPFIIEPFIDYVNDFHITVSRNKNNQVVCFACSKPTYYNTILTTSTNILEIDNAVLNKAQEMAMKTATTINCIGSITFEFFYLGDGLLVINDAYPYLNRTGCWTLDGSNISQFEQHVRAICGLDLIQPFVTNEVVTKYIIGYELIDWLEKTSDNNTKIYIYGKQTIEEHKCMGHVNLIRPVIIN